MAPRKAAYAACVRRLSTRLGLTGLNSVLPFANEHTTNASIPPSPASPKRAEWFHYRRIDVGARYRKLCRLRSLWLRIYLGSQLRSEIPCLTIGDHVGIHSVDKSPRYQMETISPFRTCERQSRKTWAALLEPSLRSCTTCSGKSAPLAHVLNRCL